LPRYLAADALDSNVATPIQSDSASEPIVTFGYCLVDAPRNHQNDCLMRRPKAQDDAISGPCSAGWATLRAFGTLLMEKRGRLIFGFLCRRQFSSAAFAQAANWVTPGMGF
jgi:hypothetical protein